MHGSGGWKCLRALKRAKGTHKGCPYGDLHAVQIGGEGEGTHEGCPCGDLLAVQIGREYVGTYKGRPYRDLHAVQLGREYEGTLKGCPYGDLLAVQLGASTRAPTRGAPTGFCLQSRLGASTRAPTRGAPTGDLAGLGTYEGCPGGECGAVCVGSGWALRCLRWITLGTRHDGGWGGEVWSQRVVKVVLRAHSLRREV